MAVQMSSAKKQVSSCKDENAQLTGKKIGHGFSFQKEEGMLHLRHKIDIRGDQKPNSKAE